MQIYDYLLFVYLIIVFFEMFCVDFYSVINQQMWIHHRCFCCVPMNSTLKTKRAHHPMTRTPRDYKISSFTF